MKNLEKYLTLLTGEVDGLLLTSRYSRHYGAEYDIAEGVAVVSKAGCRYFTDNRYTEAAMNGIKGFEVLDVAKGGGYVKCINKCIEDFGITTILVKAIDNHNFWLKARHVLEMPFIFAARKRRLNHEES